MQAGNIITHVTLSLIGPAFAGEVYQNKSAEPYQCEQLTTLSSESDEINGANPEMNNPRKSDKLEVPAWQSHVVGSAWAGHPVGFDLITAPPYQFVGYYRNTDRKLIIASRTLDSHDWNYKELGTSIGWDSHNYIEMALDRDGYLHVAGNMHNSPLRYWKSSTYDTSTLTPQSMVGSEEDNKITYPIFTKLPDGRMLFAYRYGSSGSGNQIYNIYDPDTQTWSRLTDTPVIDGEGSRNAYIQGPVLGPDNRWHLVWVWRRNANVDTNTNLSYAVSDDLLTWETSRGIPLSLPITYATCEVVDPVGHGLGLHNSRVLIGFGLNEEIIISYHKYDADGNSQVYNAIPNGSGWTIVNTSRWDDSYRWEFSGRGSSPNLNEPIRFNAVSTENGILEQEFYSPTQGRERWRLNEHYQAVERLPEAPSAMPTAYADQEIDWTGTPDIDIHWMEGQGSGPNGERYYLRWETLPANRDRPYSNYPTTTPLRLFMIP